MPSRKSDAFRRSDVSAARFVLAEDTNMTSAPEPTAAPAAPAAQSQPEPSTTGASPTEQPPSANQSFAQSVGGASTTSPSAEKKDHHGKEKEKEKGDAVTIEDLNLPKSIITRLAKGVLPPNTQIQANAILALTKSATVFISHLASTANDFTVASNKKTIMPADVFKALDETEFGFMRERLEAEFAKFNEVQTSKRSTYRKKVAAAKKAAGGSGGADTSMMSVDDDQGGQTKTEASFLHSKHTAAAGSGGQPRAKKAKTDGGAAAGGHDEVSDAETVPEEAEEEEEDEEEEDAEEEEEEEEGGEGEEDEERDEDEDGTGPADEDEALDDDSD